MSKTTWHHTDPDADRFRVFLDGEEVPHALDAQTDRGIVRCVPSIATPRGPALATVTTVTRHGVHHTHPMRIQCRGSISIRPA